MKTYQKDKSRLLQTVAISVAAYSISHRHTTALMTYAIQCGAHLEDVRDQQQKSTQKPPAHVYVTHSHSSNFKL